MLMKALKMTVLYLLVIAQAISVITYAYPQGTISNTIPEAQMLGEILDSLADHTRYTETLFAGHPSLSGAGSFRGPNGHNSDEYGIRTHVNYTMLYACLYKELPESKLDKMHTNVNTREALRTRTMQAIKYGIKTHKIIGEANCTSDGKKWGGIWQSSMWTSKLGFACYLVWDELDETLKDNIEKIIVYEANLIAAKTPVHQVKGDTKAEENGWDTNIVALAYNMFPEHENAKLWDYTAKRFAMNTLSRAIDASNTDIVDGKAVKDWFVGANIFNDYSMENHDIFHPIYQVSALYEFADSAMYYQMARNPIPMAFSHNTRETFDKVLKKVLLPTGAWAFPNGCDWSIDNLDQIDAFAFFSTYYQDADAKLAEQRSWQYIRERQKLNGDGRYIGPNSDTGARREGIEAERIMVTYMLHKYFGSWPEQDVVWESFVEANSGSGTFSDGGLVYNKNKNRFTSFSWTNKYMGLVVPDSNDYLDEGFVNFPYQSSFTGLYTVSGQATDASHAGHKNNVLPNSFATTGILNRNGNSLKQYLAFVALPDNAVVYLDNVKATKGVTITKETGIPIGFRTDAISGANRTLHYEGGSQISDGKTEVFVPGQWVNVDGQLAMIVQGSSGIRYGDWTNNFDIARTAAFSRLYGSYSTDSKSYGANDLVSDRGAVIYSNIDASKTEELHSSIVYPNVADGWKVVMLKDTDGKRYLVAANLYGAAETPITLSCPEGAPVLAVDGMMLEKTTTANLVTASQNTDIVEFFAYVNTPEGKTVNAIRSIKPGEIHIKNNQGENINVDISMAKKDGTFVTQQKTLDAGKAYNAVLLGEDIIMTETEYMEFPNPITSVTAKSQSDGTSIKLTWDSDMTSSDQIKIERRTFSTNWTPLANVNGNVEEYLDSSLADGNSYQYRLSPDGVNVFTLSEFVGGKPFTEVDQRINIARGKPAYCFNALGEDVTNTAGGRDLWRLTDGVASQTSAEFWGTINGSAENPEYYPNVNPISVTIDFLKQERLDTIAVVPRKNESNEITYGPRDFEIQASIDGENYTTVKSVTNYTKYNSNGVYDIPLDKVVSARYLRLYITSAYDSAIPPRSVQIREIKAYRVLEPNVNLSLLAITPGLMDKEFDPEVYEYTLDACRGTQSVTLTAIAENTECILTLNNGEEIESGVEQTIDLTGETSIITLLTEYSQNSDINKTYTITVNANKEFPFEADVNLLFADNEYTFNYQVKNYSDINQSDLIIAVYSDGEDNTLLDLYYENDIELISGLPYTKNLGALTKGSRVKIMIWDNKEYLYPLCISKEVIVL